MIANKEATFTDIKNKVSAYVNEHLNNLSNSDPALIEYVKKLIKHSNASYLNEEEGLPEPEEESLQSLYQNLQILFTEPMFLFPKGISYKNEYQILFIFKHTLIQLLKIFDPTDKEILSLETICLLDYLTAPISNEGNQSWHLSRKGTFQIIIDYPGHLIHAYTVLDNDDGPNEFYARLDQGLVISHETYQKHDQEKSLFLDKIQPTIVKVLSNCEAIDIQTSEDHDDLNSYFIISLTGINIDKLTHILMTDLPSLIKNRWQDSIRHLPLPYITSHVLAPQCRLYLSEEQFQWLNFNTLTLSNDLKYGEFTFNKIELPQTSPYTQRTNKYSAHYSHTLTITLSSDPFIAKENDITADENNCNNNSPLPTFGLNVGDVNRLLKKLIDIPEAKPFVDNSTKKKNLFLFFKDNAVVTQKPDIEQFSKAFEEKLALNKDKLSNRIFDELLKETKAGNIEFTHTNN